LTGHGHCTDRAILLGLEGEHAETIDPSIIESRVDAILKEKSIHLAKEKAIRFEIKTDLLFLRRKTLPLHANGMIFKAYAEDRTLLCSETYYSIGGGHIRTEKDMTRVSETQTSHNIPYLFNSGEDLLRLCKERELTIDELMFANECALRSESEVYSKLDFIWKMMEECIERGCQKGGVLPGRLKVRRRAKEIFEKLSQRSKEREDDLSSLDWVNLYALAVNEENASGSKIVTAPTNGAAGIIPSVMKYYKTFSKDSTQEGLRRFLLTSGAIGILYAKNASLSGAEVGCQGEVGVACSMAAAGLAAAWGANNEQIEQAAEIGMEHNLGLTCDPIGGLVQIPCIERNAMGAVKAINAARLAMYGDGSHFVSLDAVMKTMMQTGADMKTKYKETSRGGLAVNIPEC
jgi:L-serine dehydratase